MLSADPSGMLSMIMEIIIPLSGVMMSLPSKFYRCCLKYGIYSGKGHIKEVPLHIGCRSPC